MLPDSFCLFPGIMAVLFTGIVMSHYTHCNLSPVTQITVQQTFRTIAFMAETLVFAYLGMSIFSMYHHVHISFVLWAVVRYSSLSLSSSISIFLPTIISLHLSPYNYLPSSLSLHLSPNISLPTSLTNNN